MLKRTLIALLLGLSLLAVRPAGQAAAAAPATWHPHWTICYLHFGPAGGFVDKSCYHVPLLKETRHPIGHVWREVSRTPAESIRITWPVFEAPGVDMSRAAASCAWGWRGYIATASATYAVPTRVIAAIICVESSGLNTGPYGACNTSTDGYGSMGLMQLIPSTAAFVMGVSVDYADSALCNPLWNILAGTRYLRMQYQAFGYSWFNAAGAYNAGSWVNGAYVAKFSYFYYG